MKKKKNKSGKILLILAIPIMIAAVILAFINKGEKTYIEDQQIIKDSYHALSINVTNNIVYRSQLANKLKEFNNDTYAEEHEGYIIILNKYHKNIQEIDQNYRNIDPKCDTKYEDSTVQILCRGYKPIYEETINMYIALVSNYNEQIASYNETNKTNYEPYQLLHTEYIDLNKNGEFQGKDILTK